MTGGKGWGCKGRRGEVREGRGPGESLERTRGRGKSDVRSSSTPLHKDNKIITSELSPFTQANPHPESTKDAANLLLLLIVEVEIM